MDNRTTLEGATMSKRNLEKKRDKLIEKWRDEMTPRIPQINVFKVYKLKDKIIEISRCLKKI